MMKKLFLCTWVLCICFSTFTSAQDIKHFPEQPTKSRLVQGVIYPLKAEETYHFVYPKQLKHTPHKGFYAELANRMLLKTSIATNGKGLKDSDGEADYTFTLVTDGIQDVQIAYPNRYGNGSVVQISYIFPAQIEVTDKAGKILKTIILQDDELELSDVYHADFLSTPQNSNPFLPIVPLGQHSDTIVNRMETNKAKILHRVELNAYHVLTRRATDIISAGYGKSLFYYRPVVMALHKKAKPKFSELDSAILKLQGEIAEYFSEATTPDLQKRLHASGTYFESLCTPEASKDLLRISVFNAAMAYLLAGETEHSRTLYKNATTTGVYAQGFQQFALLNELRQSGDVITIYPILSLQERLDAEKNVEFQKNIDDYLSVNVVNKNGTLVDKNGKTIHGIINATFVAPGKSGITDLDLGNIVSITENGKEVKYSTNDVKYFTVDNTIYEPIKEIINSGLKAMQVMSGEKISSTFFLEQLFKNEYYAGYVNHTNNTFLVRDLSEEGAISVPTLLRGGAASKDFIQKCPALTEMISNKEISHSKEGMMQIINMLTDCKKLK